ncbi:RNA polymerase II degradation factor 1-like [Drosophila obscura]|uniref:RNA polymerase II degradation factor 1-like n=1 Tax=Drosophila obscura TaxID=7282 RepID=UPI001BB20980|nr:RNA polymerase II degradation factor 1-like [Drosophila obscura]
MNNNQKKNACAKLNNKIAKEWAKGRESKESKPKAGSKPESRKSKLGTKSGSKWESENALKRSKYVTKENKENENAEDMPAIVPKKMLTSEDLVEMAREIEAGRLDPETWPFNCRMPRPTSPFPTFRYDRPPTPPPPTTPAPRKKSRLVPTPEEDAEAVEVLLREEAKREEKIEEEKRRLAAVASEPLSVEDQRRIEEHFRRFAPIMGAKVDRAVIKRLRRD